MRIAIITFSEYGAALVKRISDALSERGSDVNVYITRSHAEKTVFSPFDSVYGLTAEIFPAVDALVFIGACGIAVRAIAPLIESKLTDPAVVVCDETGKFAVSLLSGHAGGANALTAQIAEITGAAPVITTASEVRAAPGGVRGAQNLILGIGCRRGLSAEVIERTATILLWNQNIPLDRVCEAATIDIKRDEAGLLGFARAHGLPLRFFTACELAALPGEFSSSDRVLREVGVDNVCERAAALCGKNGSLILKKTVKDGVAVAVFERE